MQVSFSNDNRYTVEIPTSLAEHETGEIKITNTQIEMGYHISTYITNLNANGYIDVENESGNKSQIDIFVDGSSASAHKMDNKVCAFGEDGTRSLSVQRVGGANNKVGTYSGVVCFKFDVEAD